MVFIVSLQSPRYSESDSSDSHSDNEAPVSLTPSFKLNNNHQPQNFPLPPNMTTIESMALAVAAFSGQLKNGKKTSKNIQLEKFHQKIVSTEQWLLHIYILKCSNPSKYFQRNLPTFLTGPEPLCGISKNTYKKEFLESWKRNTLALVRKVEEFISLKPPQIFDFTFDLWIENCVAAETYTGPHE